MDVSQQRPNGIIVEANHSFDHLNVTKVDKIDIRNTVYVQFNEKESEDFTIIPIQFEFSYLVGLLPGLHLEKG